MSLDDLFWQLKADPSPERRKQVMKLVGFMESELAEEFLECLKGWGIHSDEPLARSIAIEGLVLMDKGDDLFEALNWGVGEKGMGSEVVDPILWAVQDCEEFQEWQIEERVVDVLWHLLLYYDGVIRTCLEVAQNDADARVRKIALQVLSRGGRRDVDRKADSMIAALQDRDARVRREAAKSLARFQEERVVRALIAALRDPDGEVRVEVADSLRQIGTNASDSLLQVFAREAVEPLLAALNDANLAVGVAAAQALGVVGDSRAVAPLQRALQNDAAEMRAAAAVALGKRRAFQALDALCRQLGADDDVQARAGAAEALGCIGGKLAFQTLRRALDAPSDSMRQRVEHAVCEILRRNEEGEPEPWA